MASCSRKCGGCSLPGCVLGDIQYPWVCIMGYTVVSSLGVY